MRKRRLLSLGSSAWQRLRKQVLAEEPLCRWCLARGEYVAATEVDHIKDSRDDYTDDNRRENLTAMCKSCHSKKTARSLGKSVTLGCDKSGMPVDPEHHWNRSAPRKSRAGKEGRNGGGTHF
tara:strand:- start:2568 stop:2933 length:366 start_codon:yes stop_codon:yes gene_type:complete